MFQTALAIFDVFAAHRTKEFLDKLAEANIKVKFIPAGCTGELQPLDVAVNDVFKRKLKGKFSSWYSEQVQNQLQKGVAIENVNVVLKGVQIKPFNARWVVSCLTEMGRDKDVITTAWEKAGIAPAVADVLGCVNTRREGVFDLFLR